MKRLARIIFFILAWLLPAASPVMWGLSYVRSDIWLWARGRHWSVQVITSQGLLTLEFDSPNATNNIRPALVHFGRRESFFYYDDLAPITKAFNEIPHCPIWIGRSSDVARVNISWWLPGGASLIWAGLILARERRIARRKKRGQCVQCGYYLRHSPVRCPECGRALVDKRMGESRPERSI